MAKKKATEKDQNLQTDPLKYFECDKLFGFDSVKISTEIRFTINYELLAKKPEFDSWDSVKSFLNDIISKFDGMIGYAVSDPLNHRVDFSFDPNFTETQFRKFWVRFSEMLGREYQEIYHLEEAKANRLADDQARRKALQNLNRGLNNHRFYLLVALKHDPERMKDFVSRVSADRNRAEDGSFKFGSGAGIVLASDWKVSTRGLKGCKIQNIDIGYWEHVQKSIAENRGAEGHFGHSMMSQTSEQTTPVMNSVVFPHHTMTTGYVYQIVRYERDKGKDGKPSRHFTPHVAFKKFRFSRTEGVLQIDGVDGSPLKRAVIPFDRNLVFSIDKEPTFAKIALDALFKQVCQPPMDAAKFSPPANFWESIRRGTYGIDWVPAEFLEGNRNPRNQRGRRGTRSGEGFTIAESLEASDGDNKALTIGESLEGSNGDDNSDL